MLRVLFSAPDARWEDYREVLPTALKRAGVKAEVGRGFPPETVDYIVFAPNPGLTDFGPYRHAKAVLSLWAGVESIVTNPTLTQPLTRMVDAGLTEGMVEWVVGHVLRHHLGLDAHVLGQDGVWRDDSVPPLARHRRVTVLGLGELGRAVARALAGLGFAVTGWSRTSRNVPGLRCLSGDDGLTAALDGAEILVTLLPLTSATTNLVNAERMARLAPGAVIINPGRGALIDDTALLAALDAGQVGHATLDVFRIEPLPPDHPFWAHPKVTVTPHIASATRPDTASEQIAENIRRCEAGEPLLYLVDRKLGY